VTALSDFKKYYERHRASVVHPRCIVTHVCRVPTEVVTHNYASSSRRSHAAALLRNGFLRQSCRRPLARAIFNPVIVVCRLLRSIPEIRFVDCMIDARSRMREKHTLQPGYAMLYGSGE